MIIIGVGGGGFSHDRVCVGMCVCVCMWARVRGAANQYSTALLPPTPTTGLCCCCCYCNTTTTRTFGLQYFEEFVLEWMMCQIIKKCNGISKKILLYLLGLLLVFFLIFFLIKGLTHRYEFEIRDYYKIIFVKDKFSCSY